MAGFFSRIKDSFTTSDYDQDANANEYVELEKDNFEGNVQANVMVRSFALNDFEDVKPILEEMRLGRTVCLVNIRPLKEKDIIELKRSINKLKKTCSAVDGDIAGFDDDWIVIVPNSVNIYKSQEQNPEDY